MAARTSITDETSRTTPVVVPITEILVDNQLSTAISEEKCVKYSSKSVSNGARPESSRDPKPISRPTTAEAKIPTLVSPKTQAVRRSILGKCAGQNPPRDRMLVLYAHAKDSRPAADSMRCPQIPKIPKIPKRQTLAKQVRSIS